MRSLESSETYIVTISSPKRIQLMSVETMLYHHSVGSGDFTCCTLNHTIESTGQSIPCDRNRVSPVLSDFFNHTLAKMANEAESEAMGKKECTR